MVELAAASSRFFDETEPVPEDDSGTAGTFTVTFAAPDPVRCGRAELHFYCYPPQAPAASGGSAGRPPDSRPALVVPVLVGHAPPSPPLAAIIRCCRGAGGLPLSIEALATHEMFSVADVPIVTLSTNSASVRSVSL